MNDLIISQVEEFSVELALKLTAFTKQMESLQKSIDRKSMQAHSLYLTAFTFFAGIIAYANSEDVTGYLRACVYLLGSLALIMLGFGMYKLIFSEMKDKRRDDVLKRIMLEADKQKILGFTFDDTHAMKEKVTFSVVYKKEYPRFLVMFSMCFLHFLAAVYSYLVTRHGVYDLFTMVN